MSDEVSRTYVDTNGGLGGPALGAGLGANLTQALGSMSKDLLIALGGINQNISNQGYESRLQAQALTTLLTQQHNEISREIEREGCANRELQRQIQTEAIAGALADVKQRNTILEQNGIMGAQFTALSTALTNLTNLVAQLKPASSGS